MATPDSTIHATRAERAGLSRSELIVAHFIKQDAVAPESAIYFVPENVLQGRAFERLITAGVIRSTGGAGFYYTGLELPKERGGRAIAILAGAAVAAMLTRAIMRRGRKERESGTDLLGPGTSG